MSDAKLARRKARSQQAARVRDAERLARLGLVKARLLGVTARRDGGFQIGGTVYFSDGTKERWATIELRCAPLLVKYRQTWIP